MPGSSGSAGAWRPSDEDVRGDQAVAVDANVREPLTLSIRTHVRILEVDRRHLGHARLSLRGGVSPSPRRRQGPLGEDGGHQPERHGGDPQPSAAPERDMALQSKLRCPRRRLHRQAADEVGHEVRRPGSTSRPADEAREHARRPERRAEDGDAEDVQDLARAMSEERPAGSDGGQPDPGPMRNPRSASARHQRIVPERSQSRTRRGQAGLSGLFGSAGGSCGSAGASSTSESGLTSSMSSAEASSSVG
jgi:hypothetical protein